MTKIATTEQILKAHKLRVTQARTQVLAHFIEQNKALSHADLETLLQDAETDRVTIYRTLKTFIDKDVLHPVPDNSGVAYYALHSHSGCSGHQHQEAKHEINHLHFKCEQCEDITCLEESAIPKVHLPDGFSARSFSFVVQGTCRFCQN